MFNFLLIVCALVMFNNYIVMNYKSVLTFKLLIMIASFFLLKTDASIDEEGEDENSEPIRNIQLEEEEEDRTVPSKDVITGFGIFDILKKGFKSAFEMLRQSKTLSSIADAFGFTEMEDMLIFDPACEKCVLSMRCYDRMGSIHRTKLEQGKIAILTFKTRIPHNWNIIGLSRWKCTFRDDQDKGKSRIVDVDVFGGKAPKYRLNIIIIKEDRFIAIDPETKRLDLAFDAVHWETSFNYNYILFPNTGNWSSEFHEH